MVNYTCVGIVARALNNGVVHTFRMASRVYENTHAAESGFALIVKPLCCENPFFVSSNWLNLRKIRSIMDLVSTIEKFRVFS